MSKKTWKNVIKVCGVIAFVGGIAHVLNPFSFILLGIVGQYSRWIEGIVGAATLVYVINKEL